MKLPDLAHLTKQQKLAAGGVGAAGVAVVAMRARAKGGTPAAGTAGNPQTVPAGVGASSSGAAYDSTANDVYNSIQPQIEDLYDQLGLIAGQLTATPVQTTLNPVQTSTPPPSQITAPTSSPAATAIQAAYGQNFTNVYEGTAALWAPAPGPTQVKAPAGGTLSYGKWQNGVLVGGTYKLTDGTMVTV